MDWRFAGSAKLDVGGVQSQRAGQDGFITIRAGHLARPNGERFRIWGVNLTGGACFPEKEYDRQLLTHRNPCTGRAYHEEPAVLAVEIVNEHSLVESWFNGRLQGKGTAESRNATWRDISPAYAAELDAKFNRWTRERLGPREYQALAAECGASADASIPRLKPAEFAQAAEFRFRHEARFIIETEQSFYQAMAEYLKKDLAVRALIIGGSDHNRLRNRYANISNLARLDVVDGHVYWYVNERHVDQATGQMRPPFRGDTAMVGGRGERNQGERG